jgi:hypothetical protein
MTITCSGIKKRMPEEEMRKSLDIPIHGLIIGIERLGMIVIPEIGTNGRGVVALEVIIP